MFKKFIFLSLILSISLRSQTLNLEQETEQEIYIRIERTIFALLNADILSINSGEYNFLSTSRRFSRTAVEQEDNLLEELKNLVLTLKSLTVKDNNKKQIVVENLDNFFGTLAIFKTKCKDNDRGLCESGIKYLLAQDIYEKTKPYSLNEVVISSYRSAVQKPYESNLAKYRDSLYLESLKVTGRTIIDIEYRIQEKVIDIGEILNKLCIYKETKISNPRINSFSPTYERVVVEEDICSNLGIKGTLKKYLEEYFKKINESNYKKYSYLEVLNLFNIKINELNKTLELIGVVNECNLEVVRADETSIGARLLLGQAAGLNSNNLRATMYSVGDGYRRDDIASPRRTINELDTTLYNIYKDKYYSLASSPIGSIIFSKHMQAVDKEKKYYDQGLRLLRKEEGFLSNIGIMMNDVGRMLGDWDNVGREAQLLCSRYHKEVSLEQVKEAVADTINNLYAFATYASMNVYKSSTIGYGLSYYKAVRRLIMFSPILIGDLLKQNINIRGDLVELINDIKVVDKQEEITVNVLRGIGVLSIVALPLGGAVAGWTGSALAGFVVRGAGAVAGMVSSVSEIRYAGVLSQEVKFGGARLASVFKAFEELEANQVFQRSNIAFSDFYLKVQEEAHINRLLLVLDIVGLVGDGAEVIRYLRSASRLKSLSSTLNLSDFSRLIDAIHETGKSRKISGNLMMALSEISRAEDRLAIINNLTKRSDLLDFLNTHASGFSIKSLRAEFRNILRELEAANRLLEVRYLDDYSSIRGKSSSEILDIIKNSVNSIDVNEAKRYFNTLSIENKRIIESYHGTSLTDTDYKWLYYIHMSGNNSPEKIRIKTGLLNTYRDEVLKKQADFDDVKFETWKRDFLGGNGILGLFDNIIPRIEIRKIEEIDLNPAVLKNQFDFSKLSDKNDIINEFNKLNKLEDRLNFEEALNRNILEGKINIEGIGEMDLFHNGVFKQIDEIMVDFYTQLSKYSLSELDRKQIRTLIDNTRSKEFFYIYLKNDFYKLLDRSIPWKDKEKYLAIIIANSKTNREAKLNINEVFKILFDRVVEVDLNEAYSIEGKCIFNYHIAKWSDISKNFNDTKELLRMRGYDFELIDVENLVSSMTYRQFHREIIRVTGIKNSNFINKSAKYNGNFIDSEAFYKLVKAGKKIDLDIGMDVVRSRAEAKHYQFKTVLKRYILDHEYAHIIDFKLRNDLGGNYDDLLNIIIKNNNYKNNSNYLELIELLKKNGKNINKIEELFEEYPAIDSIMFVLQKMYSRYKVNNIQEGTRVLSYFQEYIATRYAIKNMELNILFRMFSKEYRLQKIYRYQYLRNAQKELGIENGLKLFEKIEEFVFKILGEDYYKKGYLLREDKIKILDKFDFEDEVYAGVGIIIPLIILSNNKIYATEITNNFNISETSIDDIFIDDSFYMAIDNESSGKQSIKVLSNGDKIEIEIEYIK